MKLALKMQVPFVIFIGEKEFDEDKLSIKVMKSRDQHDLLSFSEILIMMKKYALRRQESSQDF